MPTSGCRSSTNGGKPRWWAREADIGLGGLGTLGESARWNLWGCSGYLLLFCSTISPSLQLMAHHIATYKRWCATAAAAGVGRPHQALICAAVTGNCSARSQK